MRVALKVLRKLRTKMTMIVVVIEEKRRVMGEWSDIVLGRREGWWVRTARPRVEWSRL